jgi:DNA-binding ferritin-like protein
MNLSSKVNLLIGLQLQLKINHWQTKGIARHEAFGKTYDALTDLIDDFVEIAMGKYGRFILDDQTKTITLINLSEMNPSDMIKTCTEGLVQFSEDLDGTTDTDLLNIRDEILGNLNKLLYLLTLE